jgi:hypothetical protein
MHRAVARTQDWPAWTFDGLRENFRLVLLVATVAMVSLSFDLLWMLIGKEMHPLAEIVGHELSATGAHSDRDQSTY